MQPPYRPEEIAAELMEAAKRAGLVIRRLDVMPDTVRGVWAIRVDGPGGGTQRLTFPFASPRGIYTPAEIGEWMVRGGWPFGF